MNVNVESPHWKLRGNPKLSDSVSAKLRADFERFKEGLPEKLETYLLAEYGVDLRTEFAGFPVRNPFGKASGQLSMTVRQVEEDADNGLGFVVLKTVIAQDETGDQTMYEWAIRESRMLPERIVGTSGREGWTITWKGRGWWHSFEDYLQLVGESVALGRRHDMLVVPSCKFHLPMSDAEPWKTTEYEYTTRRLQQAFAEASPGVPMPLEKDFSPTLAGSNRAKQKAQILAWLQNVPRLIRESANGPLRIGLKLFNAVFEDEFQQELLRAVLEPNGANQRPDFLTFANRLFDPRKEFDGKVGVAYGGPDLSDRNLAVLDEYLESEKRGRSPALDLPMSATGDICSGRIAAEYALRGCSSYQLHTFFQLPAEAYVMQRGSKVARALHLLYFHPTDGLIAWLHHLGRVCQLRQGQGEIKFADIVGLARTIDDFGRLK